ncbi:hypothetical protein KPATCC21470_0950 [Kitasatospora purpeofusca]
MACAVLPAPLLRPGPWRGRRAAADGATVPQGGPVRSGVGRQ